MRAQKPWFYNVEECKISTTSQYTSQKPCQTVRPRDVQSPSQMVNVNCFPAEQEALRFPTASTLGRSMYGMYGKKSIFFYKLMLLPSSSNSAGRTVCTLSGFSFIQLNMASSIKSSRMASPISTPIASASK